MRGDACLPLNLAVALRAHARPRIHGLPAMHEQVRLVVPRRQDMCSARPGPSPETTSQWIPLTRSDASLSVPDALAKARSELKSRIQIWFRWTSSTPAD